MTTLLQDWVARQADLRPDAAAVIARGVGFTYGALDARSNQLARLLGDLGCRRGDRVSVLMPKTPMAIVALLGIYKADCIFVPLDRASPAVRLGKILESTQSRCLLAAGPVVEAVNDLWHAGLAGEAPSIVWLDNHPPAASVFPVRCTSADLGGYPAAPPPTRNKSDDAAHILFTSGSTGVPKGVVISHANVIRFIEWACRYFAIDASDRLSGHSPLHFDLAMFDIFGTFAAGAELHLISDELNLFPHKLAEFIRASMLTQWFSVPSVLNYLAKFDAVLPGDFPALRRVMWCGEVFPTPALMYWMKRLPHATFTNLYGPTETTIASAYYTVKTCPADPCADVPIGEACEGEELLVLNEAMEPVAAGERGELYITGVGLSTGYWRDPERTAAAFLPTPPNTTRHTTNDQRPATKDQRLTTNHQRPATDQGTPTNRIYRTGDLARIGPDGLVYFCGRLDSQIKSRGYRIELGEIEAALNTISDVQEAAVVGISSSGFEGTLIACAYAPSPDRKVSPADIRKALSTLIPPYMLPSRWMMLPNLPKNTSGKIDRRALRDRFAAREAPRA